ncbi:hypothetical protein C8Q76DRAFT_795962 [Earliella scabrosa]|nr:hypothetical protein C8Q76DRAFT_795962 [Earliella scabrosa]
MMMQHLAAPSSSSIPTVTVPRGRGLAATLTYGALPAGRPADRREAHPRIVKGAESAGTEGQEDTNVAVILVARTNDAPRNRYQARFLISEQKFQTLIMNALRWYVGDATMQREDVVLHRQEGEELPMEVVNMMVPDELLSISKLATVAKPTLIAPQRDREPVLGWLLVLLSLIAVFASTPFPAFDFIEDTSLLSQPHTVVLRHRHVKQRYTVLVGDPPANSASSNPEASMRKATRGVPVPPACVSLSAPSHPPVDVAGGGERVLAQPNALQFLPPQRSPLVVSTMKEPLAGQAAQPSSTTATTRPRPATPSTSHPNTVGTANQGIAAATTVVLPNAVPEETRTPPIRRHEHTIRGLKDKTVWFSSRGDDLLEAPVAIPTAQLHTGDLFLHTAVGSRKQIWMRSADQWTPVEPHQPHPYLAGYVLNILSNGEPSWVTMDTVRTYMSRLKKRERERLPKSAASE